MKVKIEIVDQEEEVIIRCNQVDTRIQALENYIRMRMKPDCQITFYKEDNEFYFQINEILFFESSSDIVYAHTCDDMFHVKHKLYELESILPTSFIRISKSTILNTNKVYMIQKNLTASSKVQFVNTYKCVYVSRMYYKSLKIKLQERRNLYEV